jgi:hypothetical protein
MQMMKVTLIDKTFFLLTYDLSDNSLAQIKDISFRFIMNSFQKSTSKDF